MSSSGNARFTSQVRSLRQRAEPVAPRSGTTQPLATVPAAGAAIDAPRPRTTRFRLERVSLLPFVPAPLVAYVERMRARRRTRLVVLATLLAVGTFGAALWLLLVPPSSVAPGTARQPRPRAAAPVVTAAEPAASPPTTAPAPANSAAADARGRVPGSRRQQARRVPHDDVQQAARPREKGASSAWWW